MGEKKGMVVVFRVFADPTVVHVENSVDSLRDFDIIHTELALKDLETVGKRWKKLETEAKTDKKAAKNFEVLQRVKKALEAGEPLMQFREEEIVKELALLTAKRELVLLNGEPEEVSEALVKKIKSRGADYIVANVALADELPELICKAYEILNLISFFTTGEDETRAWTITRGDKAPQAAGVIHTDFERNFIRAEVVSYDKLVGAGGWNKAKEKGFLRVEGKEYVVQDGDVMVIRHG